MNKETQQGLKMKKIEDLLNSIYSKQLTVKRSNDDKGKRNGNFKT